MCSCITFDPPRTDSFAPHPVARLDYLKEVVGTGQLRHSALLRLRPLAPLFNRTRNVLDDFLNGGDVNGSLPDSRSQCSDDLLAQPSRIDVGRLIGQASFACNPKCLRIAPKTIPRRLSVNFSQSVSAMLEALS